ncbi:MAG: alpha/beta hydrolase, partial [Sphingomonadaceae bacterium]|nr:alpha/beta hydrolase [Sphingomonadaceae bacterium]
MLFLLFSVIAAQAQASCEPLPNARFEMPNGAMKGVVVVAHGLNHRPDKMDDIVNPLRAQGYAVLRAVLSGHEGDMEKFKKASREQWRNDLLGAYCAARALADQGKVPLHFVGYSIGALINSDLVESEPDLGVRYDRMVYLAPAVSVKAAS